MKRISVLLACLTLSLSVSLPAFADVLFTQAPDTDNSTNSAWISETASGLDGANQVYDNFILASAGTVTNVSWTGWLLPSFAQLDGFTISFYSDSFDGTTHTPGTSLSSTDIVGNADQVAAGTHNSFGVFNFDASINPFMGDAGTQYWISIVADPQPAGGPIPGSTWRWANSNGMDNSFYEDDHNGDAGAVGTDVAFTLSSPVPEPSSLVMAGSGVFALAGVFRRRLISTRRG